MMQIIEKLKMQWPLFFENISLKTCNIHGSFKYKRQNSITIQGNFNLCKEQKRPSQDDEIEDDEMKIERNKAKYVFINLDFL